MLEKLTIENYALIERVEMDFNTGLSIITGETGAGKSILLSALNLLGGARADSRAVVGKREHKTIVEGIFTDVDKATLKWLEDSDELYESTDDGSVILRREIAPSGRSRAFVNDSPVTLGRMAEVSARLIDIHSQNSNQGLTQTRQQLMMLDLYCDNGELLRQYRDTLKKYVRLRNRIKSIRREAELNRENKKYLLFQLEQLDKLNPKPGELREVEREFDVLSDAENIGSHLGRAASLLSEAPGAALENIEESIGCLSAIDINLLPALKDENIAERLHQVRIEIKDISEVISRSVAEVQQNPMRLTEVSARMNELYEAVKRFKVTEEDGLVKLHEDLKSQLQLIDGSDDTTARLEEEARNLAARLKHQAALLTETRKAGAQKMQQDITLRAMPLGLNNLKFHIAIDNCKYNIDGADAVEFMCTFNKNGEILPMSRIASGGEMSRMMLAIKDVMADKMQLPTVIFDEVDTGVSGEIAHRMGEMLSDMSAKMQVVAITHLPQVAAKGDTHYLVYKDDDMHTTHTHVKKLGETERVSELARMLSGATIDEAALANARSLMKKGK